MFSELERQREHAKQVRARLNAAQAVPENRRPVMALSAGEKAVTRKTLWTPEMDATILKMAAEWHSARSIGIAIGKTRNSVCGRAHRLKIKLRAYKFRSSRPIGQPAYVATKTLFLEPIAAVQGISILDLRKSSCRWPLWHDKNDSSRFYCGEEATSGSYCAHHNMTGTSATKNSSGSMSKARAQEKGVL